MDNNELLPLLNAVIWEADPDTLEFTAVSPQLAEWLERPLPTITRWTDALYEPDRAWVVDLLQQKLNHETQFQLQYRLQAANQGKLLWVQDRIAIERENGRAVRLCGLRLSQGYYTENKQTGPVLADMSGNDSATLPRLSLLNSAAFDFETTARASLQQLRQILQFDRAIIYQKPYYEKEYRFASLGPSRRSCAQSFIFQPPGQRQPVVPDG
jgi:hypothetical protein